MTNEPTTGEIVRALRCVAEATECKDCRYKYPVGNVILCDHEQMNGNAADRLESQDRTIAALTARAESAERERDAAIKDIHKSCSTCAYEMEDGSCYERVWGKCSNGGRNYYWRWRGLQPQEGEGK